jgi:hypothetical protein
MLRDNMHIVESASHVDTVRRIIDLARDARPIFGTPDKQRIGAAFSTAPINHTMHDSARAIFQAISSIGPITAEQFMLARIAPAALFFEPNYGIHLANNQICTNYDPIAKPVSRAGAIINISRAMRTKFERFNNTIRTNSAARADVFRAILNTIRGISPKMATKLAMNFAQDDADHCGLITLTPAALTKRFHGILGHNYAVVTRRLYDAMHYVDKINEPTDHSSI